MKKILVAVLAIIGGLCIARLFGTPGPEYMGVVERLFGVLAPLVVVCDYLLTACLAGLCYKAARRLAARAKTKKKKATITQPVG